LEDHAALPPGVPDATTEVASTRSAGDPATAATPEEASTRSVVPDDGPAERERTPSAWVPHGPCVPVPASAFEVRVSRREAHPPPDREAGYERDVVLRTRGVMDLDGDGNVDQAVPVLGNQPCPESASYDLYVMRGSCGHLVGRVAGLPAGTADGHRENGLRTLEVARRWTAITNPRRPTGPENVATLFEATHRYTYDGASYQGSVAHERSGVCHHCALAHCVLIGTPP
jgi:hypothetical protein